MPLPATGRSISERRCLRRLRRADTLFPAISGLTCAVAYTLILLAMQHATNVSYVTALRQVSILLGMAMGVFWLKERAGPLKLAGVGCIFCGLILTVLK